MLLFISYFFLYRSVWYLVKVADQAVTLVVLSSRVATNRHLRSFYTRRLWRYRGAMIATFGLFSFMFVFTYYGCLFYVDQVNRQLAMMEAQPELWRLAGSSYLLTVYYY